MLKVRLQRVGRKNNPSFRVVVTDSKNGPKSGRFIEILGSYDARQGEPELKADRIKHWLNVGAQTSGTVNNLLIRKKIISGKKVNVLSRRSSKKAITEEGSKEASSVDSTPVAAKEVVEADTNDKKEVAEEVIETKKAEEKVAEEVVAEKEVKQDKLVIDKEESTT